MKLEQCAFVLEVMRGQINTRLSENPRRKFAYTNQLERIVTPSRALLCVANKLISWGRLEASCT